MKHSFAGCVLLAAFFVSCDWDAAERTARCNGGDLAACGSSDAGTSDAGSSDAGAVDAGDLDAGSSDGGDGGDGFVPPVPWTGPGPVGLHPRADGGYWLVFNTASGGVIEARDFDGGVVARQSVFGRIISSYADDRVTPEAATLVEGAGVTLHLVSPDGGFISGGPTGARWVTTYTSVGGPRVSVWANDGGRYDQRLYNTSLGEQGAGGPADCDFEFHDLQVLPREDSPVVIAYTSRSCPAATFMEADTRGLHRINRIGERLFIPTTDNPLRVGEWDNGASYGFETGSVRAQATELVQRRFTAATNGLSYSAGPAAILSCSSGLRLGDVSGGLIAGVTTGALSGAFQNAWGGGVWPQAFVGRNEAGGWVRYLGTTAAGADVKVLRHGNTVITAWMEADGGTSVVHLNVSDGR